MLGGLNYILMSMSIVPWMKLRFYKCRFLLFGEESSDSISDKYMSMVRCTIAFRLSHLSLSEFIAEVKSL